MIISRTPHRISFFGGGTDYPSYYLEHGGKVLGAAIDKYCYLNVRKLPPFFEHKHRIVYSKAENINELSEIQHPSVRETLKYLKIDYGVSIHHDGDIPARSGMGSSSAFTVGLLKSLMALEGKIISKKDLAKEAIHIEQDLIRENVGSQDQTFAAYGGFNNIEFLSSGEIIVNPVIMTPDRLQQFERRLLLIFTGLSRFSSDIAAEQIANTGKNLDDLHKMKQLVDDAYAILVSPHRNLDDFGAMLNESWQLKRGLSSKIATDEIDEMYQVALDHGAIGGKLLGAGGGGFMLFYAHEKQQRKIIAALGKYLHIPFTFDFDGSKIIVYDPNYDGRGRR
jgi:D-glycero-alpha-D-manno-heptose-7-phosphate kinase